MCEVGKNRLHNTVHHYCRVDSYSSKSGKLCWCYNGRSLTQNSLRYSLVKEEMNAHSCNLWRSGMYELDKFHLHSIAHH